MDKKVQSKIVFGPPEAETYGLAGSTNKDIKWAELVPKLKKEGF